MNITNAPEGTIRAALRYTAFRRLTAGLAVSQVGDWLYNLALITLVYERTGSVLWAGVTSAARVVPMVALGPLGGVIAGRLASTRAAPSTVGSSRSSEHGGYGGCGSRLSSGYSVAAAGAGLRSWDHAQRE